mgnify:CR=1 FL=1
MSFESFPKLENPSEDLENKEGGESFQDEFDKEEGFLTRFSGKAKSVAKLLILATAVNFGALGADRLEAKDATAAGNKDQVTETQKSEFKEVAKENWATQILEDFKSDMKAVKTQEDFKWAARDAFNRFNQEFYFPEYDASGKKITGGAVEQMKISLDTEMSREGVEEITGAIQEFLGIVEEGDKKYGTQYAETFDDKLESIKKHAERRSSVAFKKQQEILKRFIK